VSGATDHPDCELVRTNFDKAVRLINHRWTGFLQEKGTRKTFHPTQKPMRVMRWCISQAPPDRKKILDPFMVGGTTLLVAKPEGREAVWIKPRGAVL
jgi:site-specific DNA-methyltransferase (adenine-specific)